MGDQTYEMSPLAYLVRGEAVDEKITDTCIIGIQRLPEVLQSVPMILLGDVFIRNFYSVFDIDAQKIMLGVREGRQKVAQISAVSESHASTEEGEEETKVV